MAPGNACYGLDFRPPGAPVKDKLKSYLPGLHAAATVSRHLLDDAREALPSIRSGLVRRASYRAMLAQKTSDVLFVMGCGASVCGYRDRDWARIEAADAVGFNYWIVHDFVPRFYGVEKSIGYDDHELYALLEMKQADYASSQIFLPAGNVLLIEFDRAPSYRGRFLVPVMVKLPGENEHQLAAALRWLAPVRTALARADLPVLFSRRASIVCYTTLGILLGYKEIVLCGVDLNNVEYFWERDAAYYQRKGVPVPVTTLQTGTVHRSFDRTHRELTVDRILDVVDRELAGPAGARIWIGSTASALYPRFPYYFG